MSEALPQRKQNVLAQAEAAAQIVRRGQNTLDQVHALDYGMTQYQLRPPPRTPEEVEAWIRLMHRRRAENAVLCFAVLPKGGETLMGIGQLSLPDPTAGVEWGWLLDPALWGSGMFIDLTSVLRDYARAHYGVHEVIARVHVDNRRAARALQKIGSVLRSVADSTMTWTTTTSSTGDSSSVGSPSGTATSRSRPA